MPPGKLRWELVEVLGRGFLGDEGDRAGEKVFSSEKVVVDEAGDVLPPQPKKLPSLEAPGDFGIGLLAVIWFLAS
jgi:hypothetical protein